MDVLAIEQAILREIERQGYRAITSRVSCTGGVLAVAVKLGHKVSPALASMQWVVKEMT